LLVSGDIFDTGTPPNYALELYYNFLKRLASIQTLQTTIITAGNHDSVATLKAPKQLLQALNVHVIASGDESEEEVIPITKDETLQAVVCAVPFLRDSVIRQSDGAQTISQKEKLANSGIKAYYEHSYEKAKKIKGETNVPIIATGHLTTVGSRTSESERDIHIGGTLDIGGDYLGRMFDYVALGHLHINQKVQSEHVRYSGSPLALSFGEAKNTQKVNLVTFAGQECSVEEIPTPKSRELVVLKGEGKTIKKELETIKDTQAWIEVHIDDDNPMRANSEIRERARELGLTLLAVKVQKSEKQLRMREQKAISLEELSVTEVFEKRLELEELKDKELERSLREHFATVAQKVRSR
jgi:exonuclease SbcD